MLPANTGVHVIDFPSGRFGYVGMLPPILADVVPASTADVMGGRAFTDPTDGEIKTLKFPSFESRQDAIAYAAARGVTVR